jgi:hypothetical protein
MAAMSSSEPRAVAKRPRVLKMENIGNLLSGDSTPSQALWNATSSMLESTQIRPSIVPFALLRVEWDPICHTDVLYTARKHELKTPTARRRRTE